MRILLSKLRGGGVPYLVGRRAFLPELSLDPAPPRTPPKKDLTTPIAAGVSSPGSMGLGVGRCGGGDETEDSADAEEDVDMVDDLLELELLLPPKADRNLDPSPLPLPPPELDPVVALRWCRPELLELVSGVGAPLPN